MKSNRFERILDAMHRVLRTVCETLAVISVVGGFLAASVLTVFQVFYWLRLGSWFVIKSDYLIDVSPDFLDNWVGVRRVFDWCLDTPLQALLVVGGLLGGWVLNKVADLLDPPSKR